MKELSRREFLRYGATTTALGSTLISSPGIILSGERKETAPKIEILETRVLNEERDAYLGWATLARKKDGELFAVCSGNREGHVCPFGQVWLYRSKDRGKTWSIPQVVYDSPIDDRDAGILITEKGTILITTFTSLAYEGILDGEIQARNAGSPRFAEGRFSKWWRAHDQLTEPQRKDELGCWVFRSTDGGISWSQRIDSLVNSPHGPIQLTDGRILYPGKELWAESPRIGVSETADEGLTWKWNCEIPTRDGDNPIQYHELHGVEAPSGKIIVQIRNHNPANADETLQCESSDGGKTFSVPRSIGVWGLPSQLLRLRDGRILMSYGYRRRPFGNQARISEDEGKTWSDPITISGDGIGGDLGYPSTVEMDDGTLITLWYEVMSASPKAVLRLAHWKPVD